MFRALLDVCQWLSVLGLLSVDHSQAQCKVEPFHSTMMDISDEETANNCEAIARLVQKLRWRSVALIYDTITEHAIQLLTYLLSNRNVTMTTLLISRWSSGQFRDPDAGRCNYVVYSSTDTLKVVLNEVSLSDDRQSAMRHYSKWLIFSLMDISDILETKSIPIDNVAVIEPDWQKQNLEPQYIIKTLLWKRETRNLNCVGNIYSNGHVDIEYDLFPNLHFGFNQRKLNVGTNMWKPFVVVSNDTKGHLTYNGYSIEVLELLSKYLNFTYEIKTPADGEWGRIVNGSWTGLVKMLISKEADLVVAPFSTDYKRLQVIDFTTEYFTDSTGFLYKKPDPSAHKWKTYLLPLKWEVHVCLLGIFLAGNAITLLIERAHPLYKKTEKQTNNLQWFSGMLGLLFRQAGSQELQTHLSGKVHISFWWFFSTVVAGVYCANLVAFLTVNIEKPPFTSVGDIGDQDEYRWGVTGGTASVMILEASNRSDYKKIWRGIQRFAEQDPDVLSLYQGVHQRKVQDGHYVYIVGKRSASYMFSINCDIDIIDSDVFVEAYSVALPKQSPYTPDFSHMLHLMKASGCFNFLNAKYFRTGYCEGMKTSVKAVGLLETQGLFYAIAVGIGVAMCTLFIERCVYKIQDKIR